MMHNDGTTSFWHMVGWGFGHWLTMGLMTALIVVLIVLLLKAFYFNDHNRGKIDDSTSNHD